MTGSDLPAHCARLVADVAAGRRPGRCHSSSLIPRFNIPRMVQAWRRTGDQLGRGNSALLRVANTGDGDLAGTLKLDLKGLGVDVRQVWSESISVVSLDGQPVENRESADQKRYRNIVLNAYAGELYCRPKKGQIRVSSLDRY